MTTRSYQYYLHHKARLVMCIVNFSSNFALYHLLPGIPS